MDEEGIRDKLLEFATDFFSGLYDVDNDLDVLNLNTIFVKIAFESFLSANKEEGIEVIVIELCSNSATVRFYDNREGEAFKIVMVPWSVSLVVTDC
jgi:hypothetical protein